MITDSKSLTEYFDSMIAAKKAAGLSPELAYRATYDTVVVQSDGPNRVIDQDLAKEFLISLHVKQGLSREGAENLLDNRFEPIPIPASEDSPKPSGR
jgi:hypothetical protein